MTRPVITVTRKLPAEVERELSRAFDARLNELDAPLMPDALQRALRESDGLVCTVSDRLDAAALGLGPLRCRILANYGVGFNHIDVVAARALGITVTNTPGVLTEATADLAIALMLMVTRRAGEGERLVRAGQWTGWRPTQLLGTSFSGKTLGIVGMGRIGQLTALRLQLGWEMNVIHHSRSTALTTHDPRLATRRVELDELMATADIVSLHVPATPATRHLIDARRLGLMKPTACLINTARGDVVDEAALAAALRGGRIAGAGLDVYEREPAVSAELLALENVVLLPHL
ncbi:MAG TPA: D-glycerate dehydrogenase, partial [Gemmatimonadales bacterium]|nr:D-glycerate dehydrogenase [Gemmatimonadales bacterium]